jgi:hypothetical protein
MDYISLLIKIKEFSFIIKLHVLFYEYILYVDGNSYLVPH